MSRNREPSTILVTPLDLSSVCEDAVAYLNKHRAIDGEVPVTSVRPGEKWGIVDTRTALYAICTEGVGPDRPVTDERPLEVDLFINGYANDEPGRMFIPMFPSCTTRLAPERLRSLATGEPVLLHEFVRSFGARLEANYGSWNRRLEEAIRA